MYKKYTMVPKVECIYYLDGVWRVWMRYEMSWGVFQQSTFWQQTFNTWNEVKVPVCLYQRVIKSTSHPAIFQTCVTTNNSVICLCLFFFSGGHRVALSSSTHRVCLLNRTCKCYVMNCKYSMRLYACLVFFFLMNINPWSNPWSWYVAGQRHCVRCPWMHHEFNRKYNFSFINTKVFSAHFGKTFDYFGNPLIGCLAEYYMSKLIPLSLAG